MQRKRLGLILLIILALCAWSPWMDEATASKLAETQFNQAWAGVIDGCGTDLSDLGARYFRKMPFGAAVTLDYQCGLVMPNEPLRQTTVYVPFFGIAFGYPTP